jgi:adenylate kinase family enzyme
MKRVAVFGNAGGGKSTLARRLAELTGLPLHVIDLMPQLPALGKPASEAFAEAHAELIAGDEWIIDGYGTTALAWQRFAAADTLVHVDLPLATHAWFVTKRLVKGLFAEPEGWPEGAPVWASSLQSYRVLWPCHRHLTPRYRALVAEMAATKRVHHLRSVAAMRRFLADVAREFGR